MSVLSSEQLAAVGFKSVGNNVALSTKASIYNAANIELGSNVRIDDFCVLSAGTGGIHIGNYVHIAVYSSLIGAGRIDVSDFANLSSRVAIYSSSDDYSGEWMTNPMVPVQYTRVTHADVFIGRHVIVGSGSVVLPGVRLEEGVAVGALSLVNRSCEPFTMHAGNPARKLKSRHRRVLELETQLVSALDEPQ